MSVPPEPLAGKKRFRLARAAARAGAALQLASSRFPFATVAIGLLAALANAEVAEIGIVAPANELRAAAALGIAAAIAVAVTLVLERRSASAAARVTGAALAGGGTAAVVWFGWGGALYVPSLLAASVLLVPLAPHIVRSNALRFWTFALWSAFGVSLGFLSVLLFVVGVSAILEMVRYLFGIGLSSRSYEHIYATATVFVGPLFALGRIPRDLDEEAEIDQPDRFTAGIAMLLNWVALPLVLAAGLVLHLYAAKMAFTGAVPKNQIGWIVSVYAFFVLSLRVAAGPFVGTGGAPQRVFGLCWAPMLVVPLVLLAYAVQLRVGAEGFTAERYFLALVTLTATLILVAQAVPAARGDIRVMSGIPIALLAASSFGPWGMASTVSRSQLALIGRDFANGPDGRLDPAALDEGRRDVLRSRIAALADVDALPRLQPFLPDAARSRLETTASDAGDATPYLAALGIEYGSATVTYASFSAKAKMAFDIGGFDRIQTGLTADVELRLSAGNARDPTAAIVDRQLTVRLNGIVDQIDVAPFFRTSDARNAHDRTDAEPLVYDTMTVAGRSVRLRILAYNQSNNSPIPFNASFDLAFRAAEWAGPPASLGGDGQR